MTMKVEVALDALIKAVDIMKDRMGRALNSLGPEALTRAFREGAQAASADRQQMEHAFYLWMYVASFLTVGILVAGCVFQMLHQYNQVEYKLWNEVII